MSIVGLAYGRHCAKIVDPALGVPGSGLIVSGSAKGPQGRAHVILIVSSDAGQVMGIAGYMALMISADVGGWKTKMLLTLTWAERNGEWRIVHLTRTKWGKS